MGRKPHHGAKERHAMSTGRHAFRLLDAKRAIRAAIEAGMTRPVIEIDPSTGKITIRDGGQATDGAEPNNPWHQDEVEGDPNAKKPAKTRS
jgi:hypothetical protein